MTLTLSGISLGMFNILIEENEMNYCMTTIRDHNSENRIKELEQYLKDNNLMLMHRENNIEIVQRDKFYKTLATTYIL